MATKMSTRHRMYRRVVRAPHQFILITRGGVTKLFHRPTGIVPKLDGWSKRAPITLFGIIPNDNTKFRLIFELGVKHKYYN